MIKINLKNVWWLGGVMKILYKKSKLLQDFYNNKFNNNNGFIVISYIH